LPFGDRSPALGDLVGGAEEDGKRGGGEARASAGKGGGGGRERGRLFERSEVGLAWQRPLCLVYCYVVYTVEQW